MERYGLKPAMLRCTENGKGGVNRIQHPIILAAFRRILHTKVPTSVSGFRETPGRTCRPARIIPNPSPYFAQMPAKQVL